MAKKKEMTEEAKEAIAEIEEAVDKSIAEEKASETEVPDVEDKAEPEKSAKPEEAEQELEPDGDDDAGENGEDGDEAPVVDESLIERAVRAGMTLADAKAVSSGEALGRIVERLEASGKSGKSEGEGTPGDGSNGDEDNDDPLKEIPDLDADEFPEEIAKGFKAMKDVIAGQQAIIRDLKKGIDSNGTWIDAKISTLGKGYTEVFGNGVHANMPQGSQKMARDKLIRHIRFAEQDAKESGESISHDQAFERALHSGFGEIVEKQKSRTVREEADARAKKAIAQPRSISGKFAPAEGRGTDDERFDDAVNAVEALMEEV